MPRNQRVDAYAAGTIADAVRNYFSCKTRLLNWDALSWVVDVIDHWRDECAVHCGEKSEVFIRQRDLFLEVIF